MCARARDLDGYMQLQKSTLNEPFKLWNPSFLSSEQTENEYQVRQPPS